MKTDLSHDRNGNYQTLVQLASAGGSSARVVLNGSFAIAGGPVGYFFSLTSAPDTYGYVPSYLPDGSAGRLPPFDGHAQKALLSVELSRYGPALLFRSRSRA